MLTQARLKELLHYDPETGIFTWTDKISKYSNSKPGNVAGSLTDKGYMRIMIDNKYYRAHRLAYLYMAGFHPKNEIDHIDLVRVNNKWSNLRDANNSQQAQNKSLYCNNTSGVKGISWNKKRHKWASYIKHNGKHRHIGYFSDIQDATEAVRLKRIELHGEFANHG